MLAGATAPVIRDAVGGRDGYRVMGVVMAVVIVVGVVSAYVGTRSAPIGAVAAGAGSLREQLRIVAPGPRLPAAADHLRRSRRWPPAACSPASTTSPATCSTDQGAATILFVCFVGPALLLTPVWARVGDADRQEAGLRRRLARARRGRAARGARRRWPRRPSSSPRRRWSASGTPAARSSRWRCCPTRRRSTPRAPARTGPASTPACGPPARRSGWRSGPAVFALVLALGGYRLQPRAATIAQPDSALTAITLGFSLLPAVLTLLSLWWLRQLHPRRRRGGGHGRSPA